MHPCISLLAAIAATAVAKTIVINAGQSGFTFSPDSVTANMGDTLEFHFFGSIHTAVQGDFSTPCQMGSLLGSGFDSGSISNKADGSVCPVSGHHLYWQYLLHYLSDYLIGQRLPSHGPEHSPNVVLLRYANPLSGRNGWGSQPSFLW
jgi:plastocyanin